MESCSKCGVQLERWTGEIQPPCPQCGSNNRTVIAKHDFGIQAQNYVGTKTRWPAKGKFKVKTKSGDSLYHDSNRWHILHRIIDRTKNWYYERIVDHETGEIIRHIDEPLDRHQGRGAAKK